MRLSLFLIVFVLAFTSLSFAQVRATTESGNKVLLFDNGTWKYEEKAVVTPGAAVAALVAIDTSRIYETDPTDLFYLPSPRLVKYFGEARGQIRCKLSCSNNLGVIKIHFRWEIPVSDGNRYFGMFKEGSKVTCTMEDGQVIDLVMGNENTLERLEKQNYSILSNASLPLSQAQLADITAQPMRKMEVEWKKDSEEYEITQTRFLMETLPTVF